MIVYLGVDESWSLYSSIFHQYIANAVENHNAKWRWWVTSPAKGLTLLNHKRFIVEKVPYNSSYFCNVRLLFEVHHLPEKCYPFHTFSIFPLKWSKIMFTTQSRGARSYLKMFISSEYKQLDLREERTILKVGMYLWSLISSMPPNRSHST